jgi:hypothetical protein
VFLPQRPPQTAAETKKTQAYSGDRRTQTPKPPKPPHNIIPNSSRALLSTARRPARATNSETKQQTRRHTQESLLPARARPILYRRTHIRSCPARGVWPFFGRPPPGAQPALTRRCCTGERALTGARNTPARRRHRRRTPAV